MSVLVILDLSLVGLFSGVGTTQSREPGVLHPPNELKFLDPPFGRFANGGDVSSEHSILRLHTRVNALAIQQLHHILDHQLIRNLIGCVEKQPRWQVVPTAV
jgi:hypothetical protein